MSGSGLSEGIGKERSAAKIPLQRDRSDERAIERITISTVWRNAYAVVGVKDRETKQVRAKVVQHTDKETLQGFVTAHTAEDAKVYTDEAQAYEGMPREHETVKHSVSEYVRGMAHTNGMESFWSMLKRGYVGTYHKMSPKHLDRYVQEFTGRHNVRGEDTIDQMALAVSGMAGKRLRYRDLIADNGLHSGART